MKHARLTLGASDIRAIVADTALHKAAATAVQSRAAEKEDCFEGALDSIIGAATGPGVQQRSPAAAAPVQMRRSSGNQAAPPGSRIQPGQVGIVVET